MKPYKRYARFHPAKLEHTVLGDVDMMCEEGQREACESTGKCSAPLSASEKRAIGSTLDNIAEWKVKRFKKCRKVTVIIGEYAEMDKLLEVEKA